MQYGRALDAWPGAESATVALAALHFVSDDRGAAVALLQEQFATPPRGDDRDVLPATACSCTGRHCARRCVRSCRDDTPLPSAPARRSA